MKLCRSPDGWGPLSDGGSYLTICFVNSMVDVLNIGFIILGSINLYWLSQMNLIPSEKNWNYWIKILLATIIFGTGFAQAALTFSLEDIGFYTNLLGTIPTFIALFIHHREHFRSRVPSGTLLFYWLLYIIVNGCKLQTLIESRDYKQNLPNSIVFSVSYGSAIILFLIEWLAPRGKGAGGYEAIEDDRCPIEEADIFSVLTFGWMTPMMKKGYRQYLAEDDLWDMRPGDSTAECGDAFERAWDKQRGKKKPSVWTALFVAFSPPFLVGTLFKIVHDILAFVQPQLLRLLISFVQSYNTDEPDRPTRGLMISFAMFISAIWQTFMLHQYFQRMFEVGMRVRAGLNAAVYKKALLLSNEGRASKTTGDIVNLMAIDSQRLELIAQYGQNIWSAPFQILICMISLYNLVGFSMFAGIGIMIVMIPVNWSLANFMKRFQVAQMQNKDSRVRLLTEIINNMKSIKLYAWSTPFMAKLQEVRGKELNTLRKIGAATAFSNFMWTTSPFLVSCLTFATFVLVQDRPLTTEIVFPALTLFNLLTFPLAMLPFVITMIVEASVAVERLTSFFTADEIQADAIIRGPAVQESGEESVKITKGSFTWDRSKPADKDVLKDINFSARKGELSCIVARVGQGKSSLVQAMLGDLYKRTGTVEVRGDIAYVAQQPWVMNATVRENILFGHRFDAEFYQKTIRACALTEDLAVLPDGDETEVGEKGISLSGGQKARLSLARAVYARADIYLLDDPLSAVDQHVGRHLIDNVIGPNGLLSTKTRIMATNSIPVLTAANHITMLRHGKIEEAGTYAEVMVAKKGIFNLVRMIRDTGGESTPPSEEETLVVPEKKARRDTLRRASVASVQKNRKALLDDEEAVKITRQTKEHLEQGKVSWSVYTEYAKSANIFAVAFYFILLVASQSAQIGSSVWLKSWAEYNGEHGANDHVWRFIGIYFAIGISGSALVCINTLVLWIFCSIEAARKMHERMARAIFRSPMTFFETTPAGRILNRFSGDIFKIDELLARTFNQLFSNAGRCAFTLILIASGTPAFIAFIIPLIALYMYIQRYYLNTSRELKRLDSVSRSPIYAHFQETLGGLSTIRAYGEQARFTHSNEWKVDANLRAYFPSVNANRWLAIRLEAIGSVIILGAAVLAVIAVATGSPLSAGMVGLSMSYALQITQSLNWVVRQSVEVETNIVSVERVLEYTRLPSEAPEIIPRHRPGIGWPAKGGVAFKNYSARYREGLDMVLKDISLQIKPQEKIGIVGRTGAGKSSLTLALFRIIEPAAGMVEIDHVNTSTIGLLDLRKRLAIIPQDAALFEGTIRENLDPSGVRDDTELWSVLELAHLKDFVSELDGKLDARVHEGGSNLSQGQRQLVCLSRALLTPSNILVLDEATAAVDVETDTVIQQTIRSEFKNRTIITIAHRINTIMDSNRIVVLENGRVVEFDTPQALLAKGPESHFYKLVREAGLLEEAGSAGESAGGSSSM